MRFTKMQGAGNDYVYVNGFCETVPDPVSVAKRISSRHFGVGSDGLIILVPSETADFRMDMYNADGSIGKMCGNGIRCAASLARKYGIIKGDAGTVETLSGIKLVYFVNDSVVVDMGVPEVSEAPVPDTGFIPGVIKALRVSMGNPHLVVIVDKLTDELAPKYGYSLETAEEFPDRTNVEFVQVCDRENIKLSIWERGSGLTLSCGTGTCAGFAAVSRMGLTGNRVAAQNPGGTLEVFWRQGSCWLSGPVEYVFEGRI